MKKSKEYYMMLALKEAKKAEKINEVPIGAVIVHDGKVISRGYNLREKKQNSLKHAEMIAIDKACKKLNNFRLSNCDLYVTLEPCLMCSGAIQQSRIRKVYFGARDPKYGAVCSKAKAFSIPSNHQVEYEGEVLNEKCEQILKEFFKILRKNKMQE